MGAWEELDVMRKTCRSTSAALVAVAAAVALLLVLAVTRPAVAAKKLTIETTVQDFVTTEWSIRCPDGSLIDLTKTTLSERGYELLLACMNDVESESGLQISSVTKVKNAVVVSDRIHTSTELTTQQAQKLCDIVTNNPQPPAQFAVGRPRVETVVAGGVTTSLVIDLGDGRIVDVSDPAIDDDARNWILQKIDEFEQANGVHVTSTTGSKGQVIDADRILGVSYLTAEQVQELLLVFQQHEIALPPELTVVPTTVIVQLQARGQKKLKVELEGPTIIARNGPAPIAGGQVQIEIVEMNLTGMAGDVPVTMTLDGGRPSGGVAGVPSGRRRKLPLAVEFFPVIEFDVPGSGPQQLLVRDPIQLKGKLDVPLKPRARFKSGKRATLSFPENVGDPSAQSDGRLKIKKWFFHTPFTWALGPLRR